MFIKTITYFQQSLASLPNSLIDDEKIGIRNECAKFISKDESLLRKFNKWAEKDQEWILEYLSSRKGVIQYEMITTFDSLNISPQKGEFFFLIIFIQTLKTILFQRKITITLKNFGWWWILKIWMKSIKSTTFKVLLFFARYLSSTSSSFKNYLSIIHGNVIPQVLSMDAHKEIRANAP